MAKQIERVSVNFSRWCEKKGLFPKGEYGLYRIRKKINTVKRTSIDYAWSVANDFTYDHIGPAPTIKEMKKYLADHGCEIRNKRKYSLWRRFTLPFHGDSYIIYSWLKSKTELLALQEAVKIAERINKI